MTKVILSLLTFLATSVAYGGPAKPVECATSNGKVRYEGTETVIVTTSILGEPTVSFKYEGTFLLTAPRSDRNYVVGDLNRSTGAEADTEFLVDADLLVVDGTACSDSQVSACTHVARATTKMLCSYIQN